MSWGMSQQRVRVYVWDELRQDDDDEDVLVQRYVQRMSNGIKHRGETETCQHEHSYSFRRDGRAADVCVLE